MKEGILAGFRYLIRSVSQTCSRLNSPYSALYALLEILPRSTKTIGGKTTTTPFILTKKQVTKGVNLPYLWSLDTVAIAILVSGALSTGSYRTVYLSETAVTFFRLLGSCRPQELCHRPGHDHGIANTLYYILVLKVTENSSRGFAKILRGHCGRDVAKMINFRRFRIRRDY